MNTYFNDALVPNNLIWRNNKPRTDSAAVSFVAVMKTNTLLIEAGILIVIQYFVNKLYLKYTFGSESQTRLVSITAIINSILSLFFICILILGSYKGFL